jgi:hypothetical protein
MLDTSRLTTEVDARGPVLVLLDGPHEAERHTQEEDEAHADAETGHDAGRNAQPRAGHGGQHGKRQQGIGVAQHAVALGGIDDRAAKGGVHRLIHRNNSGGVKRCGDFRNSRDAFAISFGK